jgi:hypothetical protein
LIGCGQQLGFQVQGNEAIYIAKVSGAPGDRSITRTIDADPKTFHSVNGYKRGIIEYGKDAHKVFLGYSTWPFELVDCDAASFQVLTPDGKYSMDKDHVYYWGLKLEGSESKTFKLLAPPYAVDANQAYAGARVLAGADPTNFEVVQSGDTGNPLITSGAGVIDRDLSTTPTGIWGWARDGRNYYNGSVRVDGADYESFEIMNMLYAKDANRVYYKSRQGKYGTGKSIVKVVQGADPKTFVLTGSNSGRDKFAEYVQGERKE